MQSHFWRCGGSAIAIAVAGAALTALPACSSTQVDSAPAGPATLSAVERARCEGLKGETIGGLRIDSAQPVGRGEKGGANLFGSTKAIVPFCRVDGVGSSGSGSSIKIEVLLPSRWNGKLMGVGGGGLSGGLPSSVGGLMRDLARGYAGVANDAGHADAKNAAWAVGSTARIEDFGFRANHVAAVSAKALLATYYGRPIERSYFYGCSNGGRDALMLAQRYPDDYDGIIAGDPANNWTGLMASALANHQLVLQTPGAEHLASKLALVRAAVLRQCDTLDGVADDVLENPLACHFDVAQLQCKPGQNEGQCLNAAEIGVMRALYRGPKVQGGKVIIPGYSVSSEYGKSLLPVVGWAPWFMSAPNAGANLATDYYRGVVTQNVKWDPAAFDLSRDYALAVARASAAMDAMDPDLHPFAAHGGKLILFHGWEDPAIPAQSTLDYFDAVNAKLGAAAGSSVRLFMVPGMAHCSLGHGPETFDLVPALDAWVSRGEAPERLIATKYRSKVAMSFGLPLGGDIVRTRPLCAWPSTAHYDVKGSTDRAESFTCRR